MGVVLKVFVAIVFFFNAPIAKADTNQYLQWVEETLSKNPEIKNINDLIEKMPNVFFQRDRMTFVTKSLSPEATETSVTLPRSILFSADGRSVLSYTAFSDGKFYNEARIIQQDDQYNYTFATLRFANGIASIKKNSSSCVECHRGRMIWGQYRNWPGTFGPKSDLEWVVEEQAEYNSFVNFLNSQKMNPRYKKYIDQLENIHDQKQPPYEFHTRNPFTPDSSAFLFNLAEPHARLIYRRLKDSPYFKDFKHLWAATMLSCPIDTLSMQQFNQVEDLLFKESNMAKNSRLFYDIDPFIGSYEHNKRSISRQIILSALFGVSEASWSTQFLPTNWQPIYIYNQGGEGLALSLASGKEMRDSVFKLWIEEFVYPDNEADEFFKKEKWDYKYNSFLNSRYWDRIPLPNEPNHKKECQWLSNFVASESALRSKNWNSLLQDIKSSIESDHVLSKTNYSYGATQIEASSPYKSCVGCHQSSVKQIPKIPFNKASQFKKWLDNAHNYHGQLITGRDLIRQRALVDKDMPPEVKLTTSEINDIHLDLNKQN